MFHAVAATSAASLAIVWIGYPAVMAALSRFAPRPRMNFEYTPPITVVLATRAGAADVRARIDNLLETQYRGNLDIIVAVDSAADDPDATLHELSNVHARVRCIKGDEPSGKAAALNAALRLARTSIVVFCDTFQRFEPNTIPLLVAALEDDRFGAVSGRLVLGRSGGVLTRAYWWMERSLRSWEARVDSSVGVTGAVYAMRRRHWEPLPTGLLTDDVYIPMRIVLAGHRVGFVNDARAIETRTIAAKGEYRRKVRTLTGVIQVCAWLPALLVPFRNRVWPQFVLHKLLRMLTPYWLLIIALWATVELTTTLPLVLLEWLILAAVIACGIAMLTPRTIGRARAVLVEGALLQIAVVVAGLNGLRGRWEVW